MSGSVGFELAPSIRALIEARREAARHRGLRLTLSMPARPLWVVADVGAFHGFFVQHLDAALAAATPEGVLRIDVRCQDGLARLTIGDAETALPLGPTQASLPPVDASCRAPSLPPGPLQGLRILVVDDNRDAANTLATLLCLAGAHASALYGGQAAVDEAARHGPDAVVLDLDMPGIDGCEAARRIRLLAGEPVVRLVALTGATQADDRARARAAGFDQHLAKPVDIHALTRLLRR